jgi:hypothetical protein
MRQYVRMIVTGALGLTAAMVMAGAALASAALSPNWQQSAGELTTIKIERDWAQGGPVERAGSGRPMLLVQKTQSDQEKKKYPPAPAAEPRKMKRAAPPAPQPEMDKSMKTDQDLERAGTRKLGGEVIRNKDE